MIFYSYFPGMSFEQDLIKRVMNREEIRLNVRDRSGASRREITRNSHIWHQRTKLVPLNVNSIGSSVCVQVF